jgi:hypothetical protein
MSGGSTDLAALSPEVRTFYTRTLTALNTSEIPFLVGGAYALHHYTGIERHTKDFDLFIQAADLDRILHALGAVDCRTEVTFPHWLAKAYRGDHFFDVIFNSGNGLAPVDDDWFRHSVEASVLDVPVRLVPPEELIWQKGFIMERERFDGADVAHLIRAHGDHLDWARLLRRFAGPHRRVLLVHLILFGYIYPGERSTIPAPVLAELLGGLDHDQDPGSEDRSQPPARGVCCGPFLSRAQYLPDIDWWGYQDARLQPAGPLTAEQIAHWTAAIERPA